MSEHPPYRFGSQIMYPNADCQPIDPRNNFNFYMPPAADLNLLPEPPLNADISPNRNNKQVSLATSLLTLCKGNKTPAVPTRLSAYSTPTPP